ncbi:hypothetical protein B6D60_10440 [candidate division KSB1 bacterium 4484_87]|nr:MAG: hypothetical protein B6D60_10440 [candidate division KSB1 bacterium 4484_87]
MAGKHLLLLLKVRIRTLLNSFLKTKASRKLQIAFTVLAFLMLIASLFILFGEIFTTLAANGQLANLLQETVLGLAFLGFFIFMLVSGATMAIHYLFVSTDLPLLLSSPIPLRSIFNYKLIEAIIANSGFFLFTGLPAFIMYGVAVGAGWYYYPFMLITALLFLALPVSIAFLGALLIVRFVPPRRAREMLAILLAVISFAIWASLQIFRSDTLQPGSENFNPQTIEALSHISHNPLFYILPSTWAAKSLSGFASGNFLLILTNFLPLALSFYIIYHFVIKLSFHAFNSGILSAPDAATMKMMKKKKQKQKSLNLKYAESQNKLSSVIFAIFHRDWKLFIRDSRQMTNLLLMTAMLIFFPLIQKSDGSGLHAILAPYLKIAFFGALIAVSMGSRLIPVEEKSYWITKLIPKHQRYTLLGKYFLSLLMNTLSMLVAVTVVGVYFKHPVNIIVVALIGSVIISTALSAAGLFIGAQFGKFDWDNPKRMISQTGGFLMFAVILLVIAIFGGIGYLIYLFATWVQLSFWGMVILGSIVELILAVVLAAVFLNVGAVKLERMEWQY